MIKKLLSKEFGGLIAGVMLLVGAGPGVSRVAGQDAIVIVDLRDSEFPDVPIFDGNLRGGRTLLPCERPVRPGLVSIYGDKIEETGTPGRYRITVDFTRRPYEIVRGISVGAWGYVSQGLTVDRRRPSRPVTLRLVRDGINLPGNWAQLARRTALTFRTRDCADLIRVSISRDASIPAGCARAVVIQPRGRWYKAVVRNYEAVAWVSGDRSNSSSFLLSRIQRFELVKAKMFGIHTGVLDLSMNGVTSGDVLRFEWLRD